jgi:hypothetical protein
MSTLSVSIGAQAALDRERRLGRIAGVGALGSVACWLGALLAANAAGGGTPLARGGATAVQAPLNRAQELLDFHAGASDQALATTLRCAGLLLAAAFGLYLYSLLRARNPGASAWIPRLAFAGALLVCGSTVFGYIALGHVADTFVAAGAPTTSRATALVGASDALKLAAVFDLASRVVFAAWIALTSLEMSRTGLLDKFLAYWGLGACGSLVLLPIGDAMFIAWLGSIGILALGYWPGGRPEGWARVARSP